MQKTQEEQTLHADAEAAMLRKFNHELHTRQKSLIEKLGEWQPSPAQTMAILSGLVELDATFGFEDIADDLDDAVLSLVQFSNTSDLDENEARWNHSQIYCLQRLAREFRWLAAFGCRKLWAVAR